MPNSQTTKYASCPFCGDQHEDTHVQLYSEKEMEARYIVTCGNCAASGPLCKSEQRATLEWNHRRTE